MTSVGLAERCPRTVVAAGGMVPNRWRVDDMAKRICSVEGCGRPHVARGFCNRHWKHWRSTADSTEVRKDRRRRGAPLYESIEYDPLTGCWMWTGARAGGYGIVKRTGSSRLVHRVVYELLHGPIPAGVEPDHLCRTPACVRPDHLELVDHRTNLLRGESPSAIHARKTHCIHGHPFSGENLYIDPKGARICLICRKAKNKRSREAHRRRMALGR